MQLFCNNHGYVWSIYVCTVQWHAFIYLRHKKHVNNRTWLSKAEKTLQKSCTKSITQLFVWMNDWWCSKNINIFAENSNWIPPECCIYNYLLYFIGPPLSSNTFCCEISTMPSLLLVYTSCIKYIAYSTYILHALYKIYPTFYSTNLQYIFN